MVDTGLAVGLGVIVVLLLLAVFFIGLRLGIRRSKQRIGASVDPAISAVTRAGRRGGGNEAGAGGAAGTGLDRPAAPSNLSFAAIDPSSVTKGELIGRGALGEVWLGTWNGMQVAIKYLPHHYVSSPEAVGRFLREAQIMSSSNHTNIVKCHGACFATSQPFIVMEYCSHRDLHSLLQDPKAHNVNMSIDRIYQWALDIARAMQYLHSERRIIFRDLKLRNALCDSSLTAKISDFGLSTIGNQEQPMTPCGTPGWTAPEIVMDPTNTYGPKVDVYSFGIVLWELLSFQEPYDGRNTLTVAVEAADGGRRPVIPSFCPEDFATLMKACWAAKPEDRPSFDGIVVRLEQMVDTSETLREQYLREGSRKLSSGRSDRSVRSAGTYPSSSTGRYVSRKRLAAIRTNTPSQEGTGKDNALRRPTLSPRNPHSPTAPPPGSPNRGSSTPIYRVPSPREGVVLPQLRSPPAVITEVTSRSSSNGVSSAPVVIPVVQAHADPMVLASVSTGDHPRGSRTGSNVVVEDVLASGGADGAGGGTA